MKKNMVTVELTNDETGNDEVAHYNYLVRLGGRVVKEGRIQNFERDRGWRGLIQALAEETSDAV